MHLEVRAAASPLARPEGERTRIGFVVPRFKHTAVARNRLKRRLRELSRVHLLPSDLSADVVLRIRPEAYGATFDELAEDIARAFVQLTRWSATTGPEGTPPSAPQASPSPLT
jgi:ribonuclease P protein component